MLNELAATVSQAFALTLGGKKSDFPAVTDTAVSTKVGAFRTHPNQARWARNHWFRSGFRVAVSFTYSLCPMRA